MKNWFLELLLPKKVMPETPAYLVSRQKIVEAQRVRFAAVEQLLTMSARGEIRALIISGPPGIGKTFLSQKVLKTVGKKSRFTKLTGFTRATGLYTLFHEYRFKGDRTLIDDCDSALSTEEALNILKAALDSSDERELSWRTQTALKYQDQDGNDVKSPASFRYDGSVVFLTNEDFDAPSSAKLAPHLGALMSRAHYVSLGIGTDEECLVRVIDVAHTSGMLAKVGLTPDQQDELYQYLEQHLTQLREISLRATDKLARLMKASPDGWRDLAALSCLKKTKEG